MVLSQSDFDNQMIPPGARPRSLGYEMYSEMAATRAAAEKSVAFQAMQTGLMVQMQGSLDSISSVMEQLRQQQADALAIQQELLKRDQMQADIEEFIYQAEQLTAECKKKETDIPASSRYFLLKGVLTRVEQNGIGTPIIRGRDNKAAYDEVMKEIQQLTDELLKVDEVQEAILWADEEAKRQEEANRKRQAEINALTKQITDLQNSCNATPVDAVKDAIQKFERWGVLPKEGPARIAVIAVLVCISPVFIMAMPVLVVAFIIDAKRITGERTQAAAPELSRLKGELRNLLQK